MKSRFNKNGCPPGYTKDAETGALINHTPKFLGRNTPCPCQSGKKFKKCCVTLGVLVNNIKQVNVVGK